MVVGLSAVRAIDRYKPGLTGLKWPNDVMVGRHKVGGALVQSGQDGRVVIGLGINVGQVARQLPHPSATSLRLEGLEVSLTDLGIAWLEELAKCYTEWEADPASVLAPVRDRMDTLGQTVKVVLPNGAQLHGQAESLSPTGALCLRTDDGQLTVLEAGDVHFVRPDRR
jgi:BirA family biotin operon repressor/biotin-[acetyl-CoA-carboxylase] ligase